MKIEYDQEADAVYLRLTDDKIVESEESKPGIVLDLDSDGKIVGIEFLHAREQFSPEAIRQFREAA